MARVLLSPLSEIEGSLMARYFYAEPAGFGLIRETHQSDPHLSNVHIQLEDWGDGSKRLGSYVDPELIKDDRRAKDFISFFMAVGMRD